MPAAKGLVLVTGANGYIAARTVEAFLQAGYSVRGTVRSSSSAAGLLSTLPEYVANGALEIVEVPDIVAPGAFDAAVEGVDYIAHLAAPVSLSFTDAEAVIKTATESVTRILESAVKEPALKSFVFMSSITAVRSPKEGAYVFTDKDWNEDSLPLLEKLGQKAPGPLIYASSKVAAEKTFWKFKEERNPHFSMTAINPVFVTGPPLVQPTAPKQIGETVEYIWEVVSGREIPQPLAGFSWFVDVRDVAFLAVKAAGKGRELDGERVVASAHFGPPQAVADILRGTFPEKKGLIKEGTPEDGYNPGFRPVGEQDIDGGKAVKVMGRDYLPYETTVIDAARMFEKLL